MVRLHLGCGKRFLPGWVHVDAQEYSHVDHVTTIDKLHMFADDSIDEIYACHVLEHVRRRELLAVLAEWNRVLKPQGTVRIAVPDFGAAVEHYCSEPSPSSLCDVMGLLVGGQRNAYDMHDFIFDFALLRDLLQHCGFANVERYDWREFLPEHYDDYSKAYLPHMDELGGRLMSLNVCACKAQPFQADQTLPPHLARGLGNPSAPGN